ncbi:MAG: LysM peptidoglycan-binding domain-containing protein [Dehalococcoidia bacterium]|nr:LysM peptidoglycan-binding domain-containing protein [Dehalococcoidia bacterium]
MATATPAFAATATPTRSGQATPRTSPTPSTAAATTTASVTPSATAAPGGPRSYTVQAGDTLGAIAQRFATTVEAILALNPGITAETLPIGAVLVIPPAP